MKLKSEYGNIVKTTNDKRKNEHLKRLGYTEVVENKEKTIKKHHYKKKGENK